MERSKSMMMLAPGRTLLAGFLATLGMDVGAALLRWAGLSVGVAPPLIGRWFASLARGQLSHSTIVDTAPIRGELPIALVGHYCIGLSLAVVFRALIAPVQPSSEGVMDLAFGFGLCTSLLPWLWMFPSMGFGFFGSAAPPELMLFQSSLLNHAVYGAALALATQLLWR